MSCDVSGAYSLSAGRVIVPYTEWRSVATPSDRLFAQFWLALVVDYSGNYAFIAVMKYLPALVIATALLFGPIVASAEGVLLGVEALPGAWGARYLCVTARHHASLGRYSMHYFPLRRYRPATRISL